MATNHDIASSLLDWHEHIDRDMPWKLTTDPYKIWLSEVILQQTRVAQGLPYYLRFVDSYPTVTDLANAPQDDVMKLWQGLGYYSRARNMHHAAKTIVDIHGGVFPKVHKEVLALKGVGRYTAAAIMSFAYGERYPVVDGNVLRVISRLHGIHEAIDSTPVINKIYTLSDSYISQTDPAKYNQAIMDLGALLCAPRNPLCTKCPLQENCIAHLEDLTSVIPYKAKKIKKTTRYLHFAYIVDDSGYTILHHRVEKDIWQGLYGLPLIETKSKRSISKKLISFVHQKFDTNHAAILSVTDVHKHILTHQTLLARFYRIQIDNLNNTTSPFLKIKEKDIHNYALPKLIEKYVKRVL